MYIFPEDQRLIYESMRVPFVIYQYVDGQVVPVLLSDGFCEQMEADRDKLMKQLSAGQYDTMHPDDAGRVLQIARGFAERRNTYDVFFRSRHKDGYHYIHSVGYWHTMPDGTELALLTYQNLSSSGEEFLKLDEKYHISRQDLFYRDPLTGLPNINYIQEFGNERENAGADLFRCGFHAVLQ